MSLSDSPFLDLRNTLLLLPSISKFTSYFISFFKETKTDSFVSLKEENGQHQSFILSPGKPVLESRKNFECREISLQKNYTRIFFITIFYWVKHSALEIVLELTHVRRLWDSGTTTRVVAAMSQKTRMSTSLFKPFTCLNMNYNYLRGQTMYSNSHKHSWTEIIKGDKYLISFIFTF